MDKKVILHTRLNSDNTEKIRVVKQAFVEAARYLTILSVPAFQLQCHNVNQVAAVDSFLKVARSKKSRYYIKQVGYLHLMDSIIDEATKKTTFTVSGSELKDWNTLDDGVIGRLKTTIKSILNRCSDSLNPISFEVEKVMAIPGCYIEQDCRPYTHQELKFLRGSAKSNGPLFGLSSSKTQMVVDWNFMMLLLLRLKGQGKVAQDSVDQCHALYQSVISTQPFENRVAALGVLTSCFRGVLNDPTINLKYKRQALQIHIPSSLFVKGFNHNQCVDCQYGQFDSSASMEA